MFRASDPFFGYAYGPRLFSIGNKSMSIDVNESPCKSPPEAMGQSLTDFLLLNCVRKYVRSILREVSIHRRKTLTISTVN